MKYLITLIVILLFSFSTFAQSIGFNYKALIKDGNGNVVSGQDIDIQFTILLSGAGLDEIYKETHTPTTDDNGIIILNIGEGTPSLGTFAILNWNQGDYSLKIEIDIDDDGIYDLTEETDFKAVPFAKYASRAEVADNVTGLEKITENGKTGWRLIGRSPTGFGEIGDNAVDISNPDPIESNGALGTNSFAAGYSNTASGSSSVAFGLENVSSGAGAIVGGFDSGANGDYSFAIGDDAQANGSKSVAFGTQTRAVGSGSFVMGNSSVANGSNAAAFGAFSLADGFNAFATGELTKAFGENSFSGGYGTIALGDTSVAFGSYNVSDTNAAFSIGNGSSDLDRSNVLTVLKNGNIGLGDVTNPVEQLQLNGKIGINNVRLSGFLSGDFAIATANNVLKVGYFDSFNEWGPANTNTINLGSSGFRWAEIWSVNPLNTSSDRRLKKDINPIIYGLDAIMNLEPVSFKWKQGKQDTRLGFIAQDVEPVVPEIVKQEKTSAAKKAHLKDASREVPKEDYYAMSYTELIPILVKALQELKAENDNLKQRIEKLENK